MLIIKNRSLAQNHWRYAYTSRPESFDARTLVAYQSWLQLAPEPAAKIRGVALFPDDEIKTGMAHWQHFDLVAIVFPSFSEGRGYSQAKRLREQLHFAGELRAINAYRDNLLLLEQCGFDAYDLVDTEDHTEALSAFHELNLLAA